MGLFDNTTDLTFFENLDNRGYYMLFICSPETAKRRYEQFTRTGRYDETGMTTPFGYIELNISSPMFVLTIENGREGELFLTYIKDKKISHHIEIERAASWGWFKFSESINIERWLKEYHEYEAKRQQEFIRTNNPGLQTALF